VRPFPAAAAPTAIRSCGAAAAVSAARGFVLLEMLVALAIFAVLAALAYGALDQIVKARSQIAAASERLRDVQLAVSRLERDLRSAAARPIRDAYGAVLPALSGTRRGVELTRYGFASPTHEARPLLGRVGWAAADGELRSATWDALDRAPSSRGAPRVELDDVAELRLRYLDAGNWLDAWPPPRGPDDAPERLPHAVEFTLVVGGYGEIVRLVELPDGPGVAALGR
jgi:general secretion pathway protein J